MSSNTPYPLPHQIEPIEHHVRVLQKWKATVEASSTGFGKMYVGCFVAKRMGVPLFVIAPKITHDDWRDVAGRIGVELVEVTNYEGTATKSFRFGSWRQTPKLGPDKKPIVLTSGKKSMKRTGFTFKDVPPNALMVFDEAHTCKGTDSANSRLLRATTRISNKVMLMSATLATSPLDLKAAGEVLNLHEGDDFFWWCRKFGVRRGPFGQVFDKKPEHMVKLHELIFPTHGHRKRTEDIPGFPSQQIVFRPVAADKSRCLTNRDIHTYLTKIQDKRDAKEAIPITDLLWLREELELVKIVDMVDQTEDLLNEDRSVVIFLNFKSSLDSISKMLSDKGIDHRTLDGGTPDKTRRESMLDFQANKFHVFVLNQQAGGVGINLHDLKGRPRVSLISPSYRADHLIQSMGRICRAGALSPALHRLCYVAGSVEDRIRKAIQSKIANLDSLNDGDFSLWDGEDQLLTSALMNYDEVRETDPNGDQPMVLGFGLFH
jgi:superfamily II DNA or RNA helicase